IENELYEHPKDNTDHTEEYNTINPQQLYQEAINVFQQYENIKEQLDQTYFIGEEVLEDSESLENEFDDIELETDYDTTSDFEFIEEGFAPSSEIVVNDNHIYSDHIMNRNISLPDLENYIHNINYNENTLEQLSNSDDP